MADVIIPNDSTTAQTLAAGDALIVTQDSTLTTFDASAPIVTTGGANQIAILGGLVGLSGQDALSATGNSFLQFTVGSLGNVISTNNTALDIDGLTVAFEFSNAGAIQGDNEGIAVSSASGSSAGIEIVNTGTIGASGDALDVNSGGSVYATNGYGASIVSSIESAFEIQASRFELSNAGSILARAAAISLTPNTDVSSTIPTYISNSGAIQSTTSDGIYVFSGNSTVISNDGLIAGENEAIQLAGGAGTATVTNSGVLSGSNGIGVYINNRAVDINNSGTIVSGSNVAINLQDSVGEVFGRSYISNTGTISSGAGSVSIFMSGDSAVNISNLGLINQGIALDEGADVVTNGGTIGGDVYLGNGADVYAGSGDSRVNGVVYGEGGNDALTGGDNSDRLYGGSESDNLSGGLGNDFLYGEEGNDRVIGDSDSANDYFNGGSGTDTVTYAGAALSIRANLGLEYAFSTEIGVDRLIGFEVFVGGAGDDLITGAADTTILDGMGGNDTVSGGIGNNTLNGGDGNDIIRGYAGFDTINGGSGNDTLTGDFNADTFVFANGFGIDTITDFDEFNNAERVNLAAVTAITDFADLAANHLTQVGANAVITDGVNRITLLNVNLADLDVNDFIF